MEKKGHSENLWTKETWGMTLCLFGGLGLLIMLFGTYILGTVGSAIVGFLLGTIGYFTFPMFGILIWLGICLLRDKWPSFDVRYILTLCFAIFFASCIAHTATSASFNLTSYGVYLASCFQKGMNGYTTAPFGGLLLGFIVYPLLKYTSMVGAIVIFSFLMLIFGGLFGYFVSGHSFGFMNNMSVSIRGDKEPAKINVDVEKEQEETSGQEPVRMEETKESVPQPLTAPVIDVPYDTMPAHPRPKVRSIHEDPVAPAQPQSENYLRSLERFDQIARQYMEKQDKEDPYTAPIDRPDSKYNQRNERFYENAEKVLKQPVRSRDTSKPFTETQIKQHKVAKENSKSILYPDNDYMKKNYQNNLIFDTSSQFNSKQTGIHGGYKPLSIYPQAEERGDGPRKIVTDTTQAEEMPYYFKDTQSNAPSPYAKIVENVPFRDRHTETKPTPRPVEPTVSRPVEVVPPVQEKERFHMDRPSEPIRPVEKPAERVEHFGINRPIEPVRPVEKPAERSERFGMDKPIERPVERSERFNTDRPTEPIHPMERPVERFPSREQSPVEKPIETEKKDEGSNLSFSSIFSSGNNDTGRTQFDLSKVNSNKFADRFQKAKERETSRSNLFEEQKPSRANLFDDDSANPFEKEIEKKVEVEKREPIVREVVPTPIVEQKEPEMAVRRAYKAPPYDFFEQYQDTLAANQAEIEANSKTIVDTLGDFRIEAEVMKVTSGPTVTRYDIEIPRGIQARKVVSYDEEIARRLRVHGGVTIYPNFESGYISIEVPNRERATVGLAPVLMDPAFRKAKSTSLMFGMGKDVEGRNICGDIVKMTHMLVAGSTGSGKSVFLNELIVSLIMKYSPDEMRMILIDPKQVEFVIYQNLPHLMINEIVNDATRVINILNWAIEEMNRRYTLFQQKTQSGRLVRNIDEYNDTLTDEPKLPKIVIIIDELADLMLRAKKEIEDRIQNLTQKSRAAGIHMVIATQRPSVDIITGIIKSNLPTRVAFRVAQEVDSRTILDDSGAEKLLGKGDMLYKTAEMPSPYRLQCAFLSSEEVQRIVEYVKENNVASFDNSITEYLNASQATQNAEEGGDASSDEPDPVCIEALRYVVAIGQASISMIQRRCGVGYNRAGKIIEWMEAMGYISPFEGAKARTVLLSKEDFEAKYGSGDDAL